MVLYCSNNNIGHSRFKAVQDPFGLNDLYSQSGMVL